MSNSRPIDYQSGVNPTSSATSKTARVVFRISLLPPVIGILILGAFALTGFDFFGVLGVIWLMIGGLLTGGSMLAAIIIYCTNREVDIEKRRVRTLCGRTLLAGLISLLTSIGCMAIGADLMSVRPFRFVVENKTTATIDQVVFHFQSGDVAVGPIGAAATRTSGTVRRHHTGPLNMTVYSGGRSATTQESDYYDNDDLEGDLPVAVVSEHLPAPAGVP